MSIKLTRSTAPMRRVGTRNTMAFPRELRDAIPDLPTCVGRVLKIDSMDGQPSNTAWFGPRVQLKFLLKETGKLTGTFVVRIDLEPDAARTLAATLTRLAEQAAIS